MSHHALFHNLLDSGIFKDKLVAYYAFENNANDSHSTNNGTLIGTPTFSTGKNNLGIDFGNDVTARYVSITDNNDFTFTNGTNNLPYSIQMWVKFSSLTGAPVLFAKRDAGALEYQCTVLSGGAGLQWIQWQTNGEIMSRPSNQFLLNTWQHIIFVFNVGTNASEMNVYVDGILISTAIFNNGGGLMPNTTANIFLGALWDGSNKMRGMIDEVAIWKDRELTGAEITQLYNAGAGKFYDTF
jgi:hypothetical protein